MEVDLLSLLGTVGVILTAVVPFFIVLLRINKKQFEKLHKTNIITSYLKTLGVTKVDANFFNNLNDQGLKSVLTIIQYIKQADQNPLSQLGLLGQLAQLGQMQGQLKGVEPGSLQPVTGPIIQTPA